MNMITILSIVVNFCLVITLITILSQKRRDYKDDFKFFNDKIKTKDKELEQKNKKQKLIEEFVFQIGDSLHNFDLINKKELTEEESKKIAMAFLLLRNSLKEHFVFRSISSMTSYTPKSLLKEIEREYSTKNELEKTELILMVTMNEFVELAHDLEKIDNNRKVNKLDHLKNRYDFFLSN